MATRIRKTEGFEKSNGEAGPAHICEQVYGESLSTHKTHWSIKDSQSMIHILKGPIQNMISDKKITRQKIIRNTSNSKFLGGRQKEIYYAKGTRVDHLAKTSCEL